jgi:AsmA protein
MKKVFKWLLVIGGGLTVIVILVLLLVPIFVDVQKYKPLIEEKVAAATGRSFTVGDDLSLSLFPWVGISFSDLRLGNPPDFEEQHFASIKRFEVRVKLIPLLSKDIQVKRFVIKNPRIVLEKTKDNRVSWQDIGKPEPATPTEKKPTEKKRTADKPGQGLPINTLQVDEFDINDGTILWIDHVNDVRHELSELNLRLTDVSLERPIQLDFSAKLDQQPLSLQGSIGPIGKEIGKDKILLNLDMNVLDELAATLSGHIEDLAETPRFDLNIDVSPFSLRKLIAKLDQKLPLTTADPKVLSLIAVKASLDGNPQKVAVTGGVLNLDDSKLEFSAHAQEFAKPDIRFDLSLDQIDLDRYLPPSEKEKAAAKPPGATKDETKPKKIDYAPLRRLVLDGAMRIGELKVKNANIQELNLKVSGKNGIFNLNPLTMNLYQGNVAVKGALNVQQDSPQTKVQVQADKIQVEPLLKDVLEKDILSGVVNLQAAVNMTGDDPQRIKPTLNGKGDFVFKDGAINGFDLTGMLRNIKSSYGLAPQGGERPKTDFSSLEVPFTLTNGVFNTPDTKLFSPVLRLNAAGKADLVKETLDFRVEPKVVPTLKGQGDDTSRTGILVPLQISGSFAKPSFQPDLEGALENTLKEGVPDVDELKKQIEEGKIGKDELKDKAKDLLKNLPFK